MSNFFSGVNVFPFSTIYCFTITEEPAASGISGGAIAGIVIGLLLLTVLVIVGVWCFFKWRHRKQELKEEVSNKAGKKCWKFDIDMDLCMEYCEIPFFREFFFCVNLRDNNVANLKLGENSC